MKTGNNQHINYFLLYVSVMLIITFLQQEFVLIPQLQNLDIVGEESKASLLEKWQKWRWVSFVLAPLLLLLRLSLVSLCLFIGSFFFAEMSEKKFKDWWGIALKAQAVMILYSVMLCTVNVTLGFLVFIFMGSCFYRIGLHACILLDYL